MTTEEKLFTSSNQITTQDVLDEIALAISLSGCPLHCKGCHSYFTWDANFGEELTDEKFESLILKNKYISCILFYGGEWQIDRLTELIKIAKEKYNLKVCLYTGLILEEIKQTKIQLLSILDYIKTGRWIAEKGGLNKKTTNQRYYKIVNTHEKNNKENIELKSSGQRYDEIVINNIKLIDWTKRFFQN